MHRSRWWPGWILFGFLGVTSLAACSDGGPRVTNEAGVAALEQQGYTEQAAQCVIDEAKKQNVDVLSFLARDKASQHEFDVLDAVGAYCGQRYGTTDTTIGGDGGGPTTVSPFSG
jgi:hypothetical protein